MLVNTDNYLCKEDVFNSLKLRTESAVWLASCKTAWSSVGWKEFHDLKFLLRCLRYVVKHFVSWRHCFLGIWQNSQGWKRIRNVIFQLYWKLYYILITWRKKRKVNIGLPSEVNIYLRDVTEFILSNSLYILATFNLEVILGK